ncbi:MAG TPA: DoxX family protein [Polyangia bacterium]|nr:DoxX family protein [Polyangia bacterium]
MNTSTDNFVSSKRIWASRILGGLPIAFMTLDAAIKLARLAPAVTGTVQLGYQPSVVFGIGLVEILCVLAYAIPRTAVVGAVLLTGYLGGAIATHVRVGDPIATHVLAPIYVAAMIWGALLLRGRLRGLFAAPPARAVA